MKFSTTLLLLSGLTSASLVDGQTQACLDIDTLQFPRCNMATITATVEQELDALSGNSSCANSVRQEIELLADSTRYGFAKKLLQARCRAGGDVRIPCLQDWGTGVVLESCTLEGVKAYITDKLDLTCAHTAEEELQILTGGRNANHARRYIKAICGDAWLGVEQSRFRLDIDPSFNKNFMNQYTEGGTPLNLETGNFKGADNPKYPTGPGSFSHTAGANILAFNEDGNKNSVLQKVQTLRGCDNQAMMCCFGRDRQVDNDGNCSDDECENADPGDNSNLCKIGNVAFPGASEGDIHCHGLAWASDTNDPTAQLKFNNFFYVSLYDHMYQRGYVEHLLAGNQDAIDSFNALEEVLPPMCGCIEDMPVVSRSDCTEVEATQNFKFDLDEDLLLSAVPDGDLSTEFVACNGVDFNDGETAEDNDLASYVNVLYRDGKMTEETRSNIFEHLVGYASPNDNDNEAACEGAL